MREHPHPRTDSDREPGTRLAASAGGKQRDLLDSGIGCSASPHSLESVGESMRAALNDLTKENPEWLLSHLSPDWFDRYVHRFPDDALSGSKRANNRPCVARLERMWYGC